jgi:UDP-galactopyranose mutase
MQKKTYLVVGAGFSGAVLARQLVDSLDCFVEVWDERNHIAGNCHTERESLTGVMVHTYGPHIFNTDNSQVWEYVRRFGDFRPFVNRVKACTKHGMFSMPINLLTINQFFGKSMGPDEARKFVASLGDTSIETPANFEEQALKMLGHDLYENFFKGYTIKQWGCDPKELPASILKRLPIRFNYDDNYYSKKYQGIPAEGYTEVVRKILEHPSIAVSLGRKFPGRSYPSQEKPFAHIFYTGPIDGFFGYSEGRLGYRTVSFERIDTTAEDYQGNAVINYTDSEVPWTRIHEHKHFAPWEQIERTVAFKEFSKETCEEDTPYYPKCLAADEIILRRYRTMAIEMARAIPHAPSSTGGIELATPSVSFLGRLATYRYMDMEAVINEALIFSGASIDAIQGGRNMPVFPNEIP